jgi:hypothetical protein
MPSSRGERTPIRRALPPPRAVDRHDARGASDLRRTSSVLYTHKLRTSSYNSAVRCSSDGKRRAPGGRPVLATPAAAPRDRLALSEHHSPNPQASIADCTLRGPLDGHVQKCRLAPSDPWVRSPGPCVVFEVRHARIVRRPGGVAPVAWIPARVAIRRPARAFSPGEEAGPGKRATGQRARGRQGDWATGRLGDWARMRLAMGDLALGDEATRRRGDEFGGHLER